MDINLPAQAISARISRAHQAKIAAEMEANGINTLNDLFALFDEAFAA